MLINKDYLKDIYHLWKNINSYWKHVISTKISNCREILLY